MGRIGRPTKLRPDIQRRIVKALEAGAYIETAAAMVGIGKTTFYDWLRRGAKELERLETEKDVDSSPEETPYLVFHQAIEQAQAMAERRCLDVMDRAARGETQTVETVDASGQTVKKTTAVRRYPPQWKAAAWRLERKFPERWGNRRSQPEETAPPLTLAPEIDLAKLTLKELQTLEALLEKAAKNGPATGPRARRNHKS